ncbi:MAG: NGG1p interacting factor NIF3 [Gammaproteobacteria bacterium]|nr:MAG: NGG1p interacting factor NIF3 [Gammaproteobacteria bacterium]
MYKIVFFVPESHLDVVKTAVFSAGAGHLGSYDQCCWQVGGTGQFRPLKGSKPFIGEIDKLEQVPEFRVEVVCEDALIKTAIESLRSAHPYEEPAIDIWRLEEFRL